MLKIDFTEKRVFGFEGPNLCLLGQPVDFKLLARIILGLTDVVAGKEISITESDFTQISGNECRVLFASKNHATRFAVIENGNDIIFELDPRIWERVFIFCTLLTWDKTTYYLNKNEVGLRDLNLTQDCNNIWASEF